MKVQYVQSLTDYLSAHAYLSQCLLKESKWRLVAKFSGFALAFLFFIGLMGIIDFYNQNEFFNGSSLTVGLTLIATGVLIFIIGVKISSAKISKKIFSPTGINSHSIEMEIEDNYLLLNQNGNLYKYRWENFLKLEKTEHQIYMFLEPAMAVYIPLHAFSSGLEYESFYENLKEHFEKTQ